MNSQREAFEKSIQHNELAMRLRNCHYNSEYDGYYENSDPECTEPDVNSAYTRFCDGWQAATEQGAGEAVGEIAISNNGNTAQLFYSSSAIKALGLEDGSLIDVYTHPPKPTGGGVPDTYSNEFNDAAWVFVESLPEPKDRAWAVSASIKPALRAFVDALLATQQPPEQE